MAGPDFTRIGSGPVESSFGGAGDEFDEILTPVNGCLGCVGLFAPIGSCLGGVGLLGFA